MRGLPGNPKRAGIPLCIADIDARLHVPAPAAALVRRHYAGFIPRAPHASSSAVLQLSALADGALAPRDDFVPARMEVALRDSTHVSLEGDCAGQVDLETRRGEVTGPDLMPALDALVRLAVSVFAPASGWLVLHGGAIAMARGTWALLLGESGAGKSTAARAFRSFCDEIVLARPGADGATAASTPYWRGEAGAARCGALVCLQRGGEPGFRRVRGAEAVRLVAPHVIRHVKLASDGQSVSQLCALTSQVPVFEIRNPEGPAYLPFLVHALGELGTERLQRRSGSGERDCGN